MLWFHYLCVGCNWLLFLNAFSFKWNNQFRARNKVIIMEIKSSILFRLILKITLRIHSWLTFIAFIFRSWQSNPLFFHQQFPGFLVFSSSWSLPAWNAGQCPFGEPFPRRSHIFQCFIINVRWGSSTIHLRLSISPAQILGRLSSYCGVHNILLD